MYAHTLSRYRPHTLGGNELGFGFKPFKALKRAVHFTPKSFRLKNIMGAIGSVAANYFTLGMASVVAPKVFSAHSKLMQQIGMGVCAIAVVAGSVVLGPELLAGLGPMLSTAASYAGTAVTGMTTFFKAFNALKPSQQKDLSGTLTAPQIAAIQQGQLDINSIAPPARPFVPSGMEPPGTTGIPGGPPLPGFGFDSSDAGPTMIHPGGAPHTQQAGMMGGVDSNTMLLIGATLLGTFLFSRKSEG